MNKYLEKIAAKRVFITPQPSTHPNIPGMRSMQWDGKKTIDPNLTEHSVRRSARLDKAKSLLTKKRITVGIKTGLGVAGAMGAYHLGKSILNNLEP